MKKLFLISALLFSFNGWADYVCIVKEAYGLSGSGKIEKERSGMATSAINTSIYVNYDTGEFKGKWFDSSSGKSQFIKVKGGLTKSFLTDEFTEDTFISIYYRKRNGTDNGYFTYLEIKPWLEKKPFTIRDGTGFYTGTCETI